MKNADWYSIQACLERLLKGDDSAFEELYSDFENRFRRFSSGLLRADPAVARWEQTDDLIQDVSFRLMKGLKEVKPKSQSEYDALIYRHIRWQIKDLYRRHKQRIHKHASSPSDRLLVDLVPAQTETGNSVLSIGDWSEFHLAVEKLPVELLDVLERHHYGKLTYAEIGEELGISVKTVDRRLRAAKLKLHDILADKSDESA